MEMHVDTDALRRTLELERERVGLRWGDIANQAGISAIVLGRLIRDGREPHFVERRQLLAWLGLQLVRQHSHLVAEQYATAPRMPAVDR